MDKEDGAHVYSGLSLSHKKYEENEPCTDLDMIILSEISWKEKDKYHIPLIFGI